MAAFYFGTRMGRRLSDTTRGAYRPILERFRDAYGEWPLRRLSSEFDRRLYRNLPAGRRRAQALKALRRFLRHARHDVTAGIKPARRQDNKHPSWPAAAIAQYEVQHPIGSKARLCFALAKHTGTARVDVPGLGPQDIVGGEITIVRRKTGVSATLPVHPELRGSSTRRRSPACRHFWSTASARRTRRTILESNFGNGARTPASRLSTHCTVCATRSAMRSQRHGGSLNEVAAMLGHRDVKTAAHYTQEADRKRLARAASARLISRKQDQAVSENRSVQTMRSKTTNKSKTMPMSQSIQIGSIAAPVPIFWRSMIFSENRIPPRIKSGAGFSRICSSRCVIFRINCPVRI